MGGPKMIGLTFDSSRVQVKVILYFCSTAQVKLIAEGFRNHSNISPCKLSFCCVHRLNFSEEVYDGKT